MSTNVVTKDHLLGNKTYDNLKHLAQIGLPALGTLYFTLSQIWGLPNGEEVVGTIVALDAFLGILLGYSSRSYNNSEARFAGDLVVEQKPEGGKLFSLELRGDPAKLDQENEVTFKVKSE